MVSRANRLRILFNSSKRARRPSVATRVARKGEGEGERGADEPTGPWTVSNKLRIPSRSCVRRVT